MAHNTNRSGFTLIELLVVIAIIAILAAILFPVFMNAKKAAQKSVCLSNLKQIEYAFGLYISSYNDTCPPIVVESGVTVTDSYGDSSNYIWLLSQTMPGILDPYFRTKNLICPADTWYKYLLKLGYTDVSGAGLSSYGYNSNYLAGQSYCNQPVGAGRPAIVSQFARPTRVLAFVDKNTQYQCGTCPPKYQAPQQEITPDTSIGWWHNNGANVGWLDGHVSWVAHGSKNPDIVNDKTYWGSANNLRGTF